MKPSPARKPPIRIAVVESDPLRFIGLRALFESEPDLQLQAVTAAEIATKSDIDLILLAGRGSQNRFDLMAELKASRPDLRIVVTGIGADDETILKTVAGGAKGYIDEAATPAEFAQAIRTVHQGSVWAPRRVLSMFIERVSSSPGKNLPRRSRCVHRSRKGSAGTAGCRARKQGNRSRSWNRRKNGEVACRQAVTQGGCGESSHTLGARNYPFAGHTPVAAGNQRLQERQGQVLQSVAIVAQFV